MKKGVVQFIFIQIIFLLLRKKSKKCHLIVSTYFTSENLHNFSFLSQRVIEEKENIENTNESLYYQCLNWCTYFLGENILTTMLFYCVKSCMIRSMQKTSYFGLIFTILKGHA